MTIEIVCINKDNGNHDNPNEAVTHYGWRKPDGTRGKESRTDMVVFIEAGNKAFVSGSSGDAYCGVRVSSKGTKFLQTHSDGQYNNNLLQLPECS